MKILMLIGCFLFNGLYIYDKAISVDELICIDVEVCLSNGECGILEVCWEEGDLEDYLQLDGRYNARKSSLRLSGFPKSFKNTSLTIRAKTVFQLEGKVKNKSKLWSQSPIAGRYNLKEGSVDIPLK